VIFFKTVLRFNEVVMRKEGKKYILKFGKGILKNLSK
jgi:hypothetical protein